MPLIRKLLYVLLLMVFLTHCKSTSKKESNDSSIELIDATMQPWTAGIKQAGSGVEYAFNIKVQEEGISFDSAWVNGERLYLKVLKDGKIISNDQSQISVGDELKLRCSGSDKIESPISAPRKLEENQALIRYAQGNKKSYFKISEIKELERSQRQ